MKEQGKIPVVCPISPTPPYLAHAKLLSLCPVEAILHSTVLLLSSVFTSLTFPPEISTH